MAMVGASMCISFAVSLGLAPVVVGEFCFAGLFWAISLLGFVCLLIASFVVPSVPQAKAPIVQPRPRDVLGHSDLLRLNFGVFCLHFILMALFIVMPGLLATLGQYDSAHLWEVYFSGTPVFFVFMLRAGF